MRVCGFNNKKGPHDAEIKIRRKPQIFHRLFGINVDQFEEILQRTKPGEKSPSKIQEAGLIL